MALSTSSNFSVVLLILFVKLAKTPAIAVATLSSLVYHHPFLPILFAKLAKTPTIAVAALKLDDLFDVRNVHSLTWHP